MLFDRSFSISHFARSVLVSVLLALFWNVCSSWQTLQSQRAFVKQHVCVYLTFVNTVAQGVCAKTSVLPRDAARGRSVYLPGCEEVHRDGHGAGDRAQHHGAGEGSGREAGRYWSASTAAARVQESGPDASSLYSRRHHHLHCLRSSSS